MVKQCRPLETLEKTMIFPQNFMAEQRSVVGGSADIGLTNIITTFQFSDEFEMS